MLPVVLFQRQREFIAWLHERFTTKTSAPVEKSRDFGATWMSCAFRGGGGRSAWLDCGLRLEERDPR